MFEQDIGGLIKALRANKHAESRVIEQALEETQREVRSSDMAVKASAVLKLVYIEMLGYSIAFASFSIVECMSSPLFSVKSTGYLAASQCFNDNTDVAVLIVNLVQKDLRGADGSRGGSRGDSPARYVGHPLQSAQTAGQVTAHYLMILSAVATLLSPALTRELGPDLLALTTHPRPLVRRQSLLVLWGAVRAWPALAAPQEDDDDDSFIAELRERLNDDDPGVVGATVNLVCELARRSPARYLALAPDLYGLLTDSTNNWMLIKIVKLFAVLTPHEPRLVRKLVPPLTELIENTQAMSLLYECIQTSIVGGMLTGPDADRLASICVTKLQAFLDDSDQNLRYIALVALCKILPSHKHLVSAHYEAILDFMDYPDSTVRSRALDLIQGMVEQNTLIPMVEKLMSHIRGEAAQDTSTTAAERLVTAQLKSNGTGARLSHTPAYKASLVSLIIDMVSQDTYSYVLNFEWLVDTLLELVNTSLSLPSDVDQTSYNRKFAFSAETLGTQLRNVLIDLTARARGIRSYAVQKMSVLINDEHFVEAIENPDMFNVLEAAAFICGEYAAEMDDARPVMASLFDIPSTMPAQTASSYLHNGAKIYAYWLSSLSASWQSSHAPHIQTVTSTLIEKLSEIGSRYYDNFDLRQRSNEFISLFSLILEGVQDSNSKTSEDVQVSDSVEQASDPRNSEDGGGPVQTDTGSGFADADGFNAPPLPPPVLNILEPLFFSHPLNPVNPKAQSMIVSPVDLDTQDLEDQAIAYLEEAIDVSPPDVSDDVDDYGRIKVTYGRKAIKSKAKSSTYHDSPEGTHGAAYRDNDEVDNIPIIKLNLDDVDHGTAKPKTKTRTHRRIEPKPVYVDVDGEMPDENLLLSFDSSSPTGTRSRSRVSGHASDSPSAVAIVADEDVDSAEVVNTDTIQKKIVKKKKKSKTREGDTVVKKKSKKKSPAETLA